MALNVNALVSLAEAKSVLGIEDASYDAKIEEAINEASALTETVYCHRPLAARVLTNARVEGPCYTRALYPELWPINRTAAIAIAVNGTAQTVWRSEADGDPTTFDVMAFDDHFDHLSGGWAPTSMVRLNVLLSYTGGYSPVPDDLKIAVLDLIARLWPPRFGQQPDVLTLSGPGGAVTYDQSQYMGGASTGDRWALSQRSRDVFASYRRVLVG